MDYTVLKTSPGGYENVFVFTKMSNQLTVAVPTKDQTGMMTAKVNIGLSTMTVQPT